MMMMEAPSPHGAERQPPSRLPSKAGASYRSALWVSEYPSASVSFTIIQSKTSPARVLNVFPVGAGGEGCTRVNPPGPGGGEMHQPLQSRWHCLQPPASIQQGGREGKRGLKDQGHVTVRAEPA